MSDLSPGARALLDQTRDLGEPDDSSLVRVRGVLLARIGAAAVTTVAASAIASTFKVAPTVAPTLPLAAGTWAVPLALRLLPVLGKVLAAAAVTGGMVASVYAVQTQSIHVAPPAAHAQVAPPAAVTREMAHPQAAPRRAALQRPAPSEASPAPAAVVSAAAARDGARVSAARPAATPRASPAPLGAPTASVGAAARISPLPQTPGVAQSATLAQDVENLREAQAALVAGDAPGAIGAAARVDANGALAEEGHAVRVLAQCALDASAGRIAADAFAKRYPRSALLVRVRTACMPEGRSTE